MLSNFFHSDKLSAACLIAFGVGYFPKFLVDEVYYITFTCAHFERYKLTDDVVTLLNFI